MNYPRLFLLVICLLVAGHVGAQEFDARKPLTWPSQDPYLDRALASSPVSALAGVAAIHGFVRDSIATEVYEGALRGARGTLLLTAGNSLDKSLLLAELLARTNRRVRLVQGDLTDEQATQLLSRMDADLTARAASLRAGATVDLKSIPGAASADEEEKEDLDYVISARAALLNRITELWTDLGRFAAMVPLPAADQNRRNDQAQREQLRKIAKTHFWVQVEEGGNWLDLDPTLATPRGRAPAAIRSRYEAGQVPDVLRHAVEFEIRSTFQQDDQRKTQTNLLVRSFADQLGHLPIVLVHPGKGDPFASLVKFDVLPTGATGGLPFTPVLYLGSQPYRGKPLTMNGWSEANAFFGGSKPAIVDEQLRVRTQSPNASPRESTRWIFNRVPVQERSKAGAWALEALPETKEVRVVDAGENLKVDLMPQALRGIWAFRVGVGPGNAGLVEEPVVLEQDVVQIGDPVTILSLTGILESAAFVDLVARVTVGGAQYFPVSTGPTLTAFMIGARASDGQKNVDLEATAAVGMDLVDVYSMPLAGGDYQGHGLLSLAIEQGFVEVLAGRQGDPELSIFTVRNVLATAEKFGIPLVPVVEPAGLSRLEPLIRSAIAPDVANGAVLVSQGPVIFRGAKEFVWLVFDNRTRYASDGSSLDAGSGLVEYIKNNKAVIRITETLCRFRQCLSMASKVAAGTVKILRGKIEMRAIVDVTEIYQDASDCAKVNLTIPVYKVWKKGMTQADRDIRNKMSAMQEAARKGELKVPSRREYNKNRERDAAEFADVRERQLGRKRRDDEEWDHRIELGCGGKHEESNVFPLDASYNSSIGNFLGRACQALCDGSIVNQITFKFILPGRPGLTSANDFLATNYETNLVAGGICDVQ